MDATEVRTAVRVAAVLSTGIIALSAYAGVVGLLGGGISFGPQIDARLPFGSLVLAGVALLAIVAFPMTVACIAAVRSSRWANDLVFGAGVLLVGWIGVELAFIKAYSWFHPTYLAAAVVVLALAWLGLRVSAAVPTESEEPTRSPLAEQLATAADDQHPRTSSESTPGSSLST